MILKWLKKKYQERRAKYRELILWAFETGGNGTSFDIAKRIKIAHNKWLSAATLFDILADLITEDIIEKKGEVNRGEGAEKRTLYGLTRKFQAKKPVDI